jgi:exodeoxyribonuclease VII small subunit
MPRATSTGAKGARPKAAAAVVDELPFEQAIAKLEAIVERLEDGELDLEASLEAFEQGVALSKRCAGQLDDAERRIEILVKEGGETLERPFDEAGDDEEAG